MALPFDFDSGSTIKVLPYHCKTALTEYRYRKLSHYLISTDAEPVLSERIPGAGAAPAPSW
jgi:hypothetical protein